ncbi:MAG: rhomboid family intramembrane serine protease [Spirochaetaceae bacterium]|nr:MAG: rhomboid family intramembrane serine protease [Spirochaetaceae bacterium]
MIARVSACCGRSRCASRRRTSARWRSRRGDRPGIVQSKSSDTGGVREMVEIVEVKKNPLSVLFLVVSVGVFAVAQLTDPENVRFLAFDSAEWPGRWYALVTYGFVHVDWNHIIINMLLVVWIGTWVERLIGSARYALLVFSAIVAGGVTLLVRQTAGIGFSAAVAAILFYYHFAFPWKRELPLGVPNIVLPVALFFLSTAAIVFGWLPAVGHIPHIAGALVGLVLLVFFRRYHRPIDDDPQDR